MYRKKDDLLNLIQSLNNGEKRHFTNMFKPNKGENLPMFLQLYEIHENGQSEVPNDLFNTSSQTLVTAKRHLYACILKSLRILLDNISIDTTLQNQLIEVEILNNHRLPRQASLILKKAYELAMQYEKYAHLHLVLEWEKKLNIALDEPSRPTIEIISEQNQVSMMAQQLNKLESLYSHILLLKRKYGYVKGEVAELVRRETILSDEMVEEKECYGEKSRYYRNFIFSIFHWMTFEHWKALDYSRKLLITEQHSILPSDYISGIFQHITSSICVGHFDDTMMAIRIAELYSSANHLDVSANFTTMLFAYKSTYQIKVLTYKGELKPLKKCLKTVESELKGIELKLSIDQAHIIKGNLMNGFMVIGEYGKAQKIWDELFDQQKSMRKDIFADLFIFRLFMLLNTKSYDQIPVAAKAAVRYFKKSEQESNAGSIEMEIAKLLSKSVAFKVKQDRVGVVESIKESIFNFIKTTNPQSMFQEHYSRYLIWCDAIIEEEYFYLSAKKWYSKFRRTMHKRISRGIKVR